MKKNGYQSFFLFYKYTDRWRQDYCLGTVIVSICIYLFQFFDETKMIK